MNTIIPKTIQNESPSTPGLSVTEQRILRMLDDNPLTRKELKARLPASPDHIKSRVRRLITLHYIWEAGGKLHLNKWEPTKPARLID